MLDERVRVARLLDIYGALLTEKQQRILSRHVLEDCSLGEIAEEESISRQAVHDTVRRGIQGMEEYEKALELIKNQESQKAKLQEILRDLDSSSESDRQKGIEKIRMLIES